MINALISSPVGLLTLTATQDGLTSLKVAKLNPKSEQVSLIDVSKTINVDDEKAMKIISHTITELQEYFDGKLTQFSVPLAPKGTAFQHSVWQALSDIEYGKACSYADIANKIQNPKAVRAVGAANGANPIAIIVPCHRVIGKSGKLTGYAYGLEMKGFLLTLEGVN